MKRFQDKVCVVTASTAGIGLAIAERFATEGAKVVLSSRKQEGVDKAIARLRALPGVVSDNIAGMVCHVGKKEHRLALLEFTKTKFGSIDVLVLNAAASTHFGKTMKIKESLYDKMFELNVKATFFMAQDAVPYLTPMPANPNSKKVPSHSMPSQFSTNILLVASLAGYVPAAPIGIYGVTKTAMFGLTKAMAKDFGPKGIRVNCLAPGVIRTDFAQLLVDSFEAGKPVTPDLATQCVLGRVGEASEMGGVASFLCSADASYVTGEITVAAGGTPRL